MPVIHKQCPQNPQFPSEGPNEKKKLNSNYLFLYFNNPPVSLLKTNKFLFTIHFY